MKLIKKEILRAVKDPEWLRKNDNSRKAQVQVTNYLNALRRAGLIKKGGV